MGKPLGLLQRIFSFSKASKRSDPRFDLLQSTNEHGQGIDRDDEHEDPLLANGSIRTTGGIGGLGRGITNAPGELTPTKPNNGSSKGREGGMKKRRLRRASLSASNLLSWGQERVGKTGGRIPSDSSQEPPVTSNDGPADERHEKIEPGQYSARNGHGIKVNTHSERQDNTLSNGTNEGNNRDSRRRPAGGDEQFTRLLRSSSTNYRVISETDYRALDPIEHPINALKFPPPPSTEPQTPHAAGPPSSWTPKSQARTLAFPPLQVPSSLTHIPSVTSTTTTSTYKVTVHRRRVHSRTSFPDANRALDHLHSNSSIDTSKSSPCPSPELRGALPVSRPTETVVDTKSSDHKNVDLESTVKREEVEKWAGPVRLGSGPSMIPRWSSLGHADKAKGRAVSQIFQSAAVSQIHPVGPLRTVPPALQRGTILAPAEVLPEPRNHVADKAHHYTMPLKGANSSTEEGAQLSDTGDASMARSTASKYRGVLKKKRRGSHGSLSTTPARSLKRANSVKSERSSKPESESGPKNRLKGSLRNMLSIITAVEGVVDRLHASAVGQEISRTPAKSQLRDEPPAQMATTSRSPQILQSGSMKQISSIEPAMSKVSKRSSISVHDWISKKAHTEPHSVRQAPVLSTPRDKGRLAKLRKDPSVASLLEMYEADGSLKRSAFSNTPPSKGPNGHLMKGNRESKIGCEVGVPVASKCHDQFRFPVPLSPSTSSKHRDELSVDSIGPETPSQEDLQLELSSSFNRTPDASAQAGMNTSLFVEMGSGGHIESSDDGSVSDGEIINQRREAARRKLEGTTTPTKAPVAANDGDNVNLKSPTRRASEVFAFLDFPKEDSDASFEVGALEDNSDEGRYLRNGLTPYAGEVDRASRLELDLGQPLSLSPSLLIPKTSPYKRPLGPRGPPGLGLAHTSTTTRKKPGQMVSRIPRRASSLKLSGANVSAETSSVPLTGATFGSDSFASQNTTDRSIYRGIYSYLKDSTSKIPIKATTKAATSSPDIIQETPAHDNDNPFLATPLNIDKALPSTPSTESDAEISLRSSTFRTPNRSVGTFAPLPLFSPLSPLDAGMTVHKFKVPRTPETPSPSKQPTKSIVKDRIAKLEGIKPLDLERQRIQRQEYPSIPRSLSIKRGEVGPRALSGISTIPHGKAKGLGDGRAFNAANPAEAPTPEVQAAKLLSPKKRSGNGAQTNANNPLDFTQSYPFSEDLFPAIFMPGGPTVAKTSNLLQTPQRHPSQTEPSPASSSKLGVYGREIMALARSKSGKLLDGKL